MSAPQLENGYTRIANEILEALAKIKLSPYETRLMWIIFRKTYGNNGKKMDRISLSQFSEWTGIDRRNVRRALASLLAREVVAASPNGNGINYGLQKDYERWKPRGVSAETLSAETPEVVSAETPKVVSAETPTKEKEKKEIVKGKPSPSKNSDSRVKEFFGYWEDRYRERFGEPYVFNWGKDGKLIKTLLSSFDLPKLKSLALRFLDSKDPWVQEHGGYTIGVFASKINMLASTSRETPRQPHPKEKPNADLAYSPN